MIVYATSPADISAAQLHGFFVGWPNSPSPQAHLRILHGSAHVVLALDDATNNVVGFVTAISDGVSCAYIPHLEVLPAYQSQGIGSALMRRMLDQLRELYMIDLICDPDVQPFYERIGMRRAQGMLIRNYERQNCA
jgi:ribosomal protein S18 acetylase RimI-like enzyme